MLRMTRQDSHSQRVCGDIPCHDASCADDRAVPDGYAGKHDDAAAQPAPVSDSNGQGVGAAEIFLRLGVPVRSQPFRQLYRMRRRVKLYIGSDQNIVSDFDFIAVHKGAVHVNGHIVSDMDIVSVIAEKGWATKRLYRPHRTDGQEFFLFSSFCSYCRALYSFSGFLASPLRTKNTRCGSR